MLELLSPVLCKNWYFEVRKKVVEVKVQRTSGGCCVTMERSCESRENGGQEKESGQSLTNEKGEDPGESNGAEGDSSSLADNEPISISYDSVEYFASYEDLSVHRLMLQDKVRTNAYLDAIKGAGSLFKNKVIMDVGAGTGILSLFCAQAGAKRVYAVEASNLAKRLPDVATKNGFENVISVIHSKVEDIQTLPDNEPNVDIIVSEWMGFYLLHESMLDSVLYARDKFLKPDGHMFPNTAQIYGAPCSVPDIWKENIDFWSSKDLHYGFDLSSFSDIAKHVNKPMIEIVPSDGLLSDPQLLFDLNLQTIPLSKLQSFKDRRFFTMEQSGDMHAVSIWFTCTFPVVPGQEPIELSTAPWTEATHWKQTLILLPNKLEFEEGDITGWELIFEKSTEQDSRSYTIQYQCLDADQEHPVPCDCGSVKCEIIKHYISQEQAEGVPNE